MPRILVVDAHRPDVRAVAEAAAALRAGRLVAFPTETVYGLGARASDASAVHRIFVVKGRPEHHPLIAHVESEAAAAALALAWPPSAARLAGAFWPGPLTIIVDRARHVPSEVAGGGDSIAVRAPAHPVARALLRELGEAIAAPSANRYQGVSPTLAAHVVKELGDGVDLVVDGGPCEAGIESTVVDVRGVHPRVLRPGATSMAALRALLPDIEAATSSADGSTARASPGMDLRHYAPRATLEVVEADDIARTLERVVQPPGRAGLVFHSPRGRAAALAASASHDGILGVALASEPDAYARQLYRTLHDLDDAGVDAIVIERVPSTEPWWAVADRLKRASR
jgi:L-threonylcarbamoyladenylate synthase